MMSGYTSALDIARDIIAMQHRIDELEWQVEHLEGYKKMYLELLDQDIKHNEEMTKNMLLLALNQLNS